MTMLSAGANIPVPGGDLTLRVRRDGGAQPNAVAVDVCALLVAADGRVRSDDDFVFYNQPEAAGGAVRHLVGPIGIESLAVRPDGLPADVERVVVAASVDVGTLAGVTGLAVDVLDAHGGDVAVFAPHAAGRETLLVLGELYRRHGAWRFRAVGQGYATGLAGLATDYGVTIDDEPVPAPPAPVATSVPAQVRPPGTLPVAPVLSGASPRRPLPHYADEPTMRLPHQATLPPDLGARIDLRKEKVRVTLEKKGLTGVRARVAIVLDRSGSMRPVYAAGVVGRLVERLAPVAAKLDDDGTLDAWIFADDFARLEPLRVPDLPRWIAANVYINQRSEHRYLQVPPLPDGKQRDPDRLAHVRGGNNEPLVMQDVIDRYAAEAGPPVLVLFFSDGGVNRSRQIQHLLTDAARRPLFWQFVGLGRSDYGILERFDTMPGRFVDNAGFFQVDDIDTVSDDELYDRILHEFPQWLAEARSKGVVS